MKMTKIDGIKKDFELRKISLSKVYWPDSALLQKKFHISLFTIIVGQEELDIELLPFFLKSVI